MEMIMSIKTKYVDKIFAGEKKYEFRKRVSKKFFISLPLRILIYATSPLSKIVSEMFVDDITIDNIDDAWNRFRDVSGLQRKEFLEYYKNNSLIYALRISSAKKYDNPFELGFRPPQSYFILTPNKKNCLINKIRENRELWQKIYLAITTDL